MAPLSITPARFLSLALVALVHVLLLSVLFRAAASAAPAVLPVVMEVSLLPPLLAPPRPQHHLPLPHEASAKPAATPVSPASRVPAATVVPVASAATSTAAVNVPAQSLPAPVEPDPAAMTESVPPRADASRLGNNPPVYPSLSRRLGEQGRVLLSLQVLADGSLGQLRLKQSSGYRRLDDAAMAAVRTWTFLPARQNGVAVTATYLQALSFSLHDRH